jgi:hypothetical protein
VDCYSNPLGWTQVDLPELKKGQDGSDSVTVSLKSVRKATKIISNAISSRKLSNEERFDAFHPPFDAEANLQWRSYTLVRKLQFHGLL